MIVWNGTICPKVNKIYQNGPSFDSIWAIPYAAKKLTISPTTTVPPVTYAEFKNTFTKSILATASL